VRQWDAATGSEVRRFTGHHGLGQVKCVAVSPDGAFAVSGGNDGSILVWDLTGGGSKPSTAADVSDVVAAERNQVIMTSSPPAAVVTPAAVLGAEVDRFVRPEGAVPLGIALTADGVGAVTTYGSGGRHPVLDNLIELRDLATGTVSARWNADRLPHQGAINAVAVSAAGRQFVTGGQDNRVVVRAAGTETPLCVFDEHLAGVTGVALPADGVTAVTSSQDGTLALWNLDTGTLTRSMNSGGTALLAVANDPGQGVVAATADGRVVWWDLSGTRVTFEAKAAEVPIHDAAVSADGRVVVLGADDGTLHVWDNHARRSLREIAAHSEPIRAVAISRDGQWALTGSADNTLRLWRVGSGSEASLLMGHEDDVSDVVFGADGRSAVSVGLDGRMLKWSLPVGVSP